MKLHYYPETDSLYIELSNTSGVETREVADGLVADFDSVSNVVGLDIDHASRKLDLSKSKRSRCRRCMPRSESRRDSLRGVLQDSAREEEYLSLNFQDLVGGHGPAAICGILSAKQE
jgi:uncharacterized protein YuzE